MNNNQSFEQTLFGFYTIFPKIIVVSFNLMDLNAYKKKSIRFDCLIWLFLNYHI